MRLQTKQVIVDLWKLERNNYPGMSYYEFAQICKTPVAYIKECMESPELPVLRIRYFGIFEVYTGKVENILRRLDNRFNRKRIGQEKYNKLKLYYEDLLEKLQPVTKIVLIDDTEDIVTAQEIEVKPKTLKGYRGFSSRQIEV